MATSPDTGKVCSGFEHKNVHTDMFRVVVIGCLNTCIGLHIYSLFLALRFAPWNISMNIIKSEDVTGRESLSELSLNMEGQ